MRQLWLTACLAATALAAGCVFPGQVDANLLTRYQDWARAQSPQPREDGEGLGLLRPDEAKDVVELKVTTDPSTKLKTVTLSLDEAVRLALLNSLDIRVQAMEPALSREEVIQAAAEFDYVVFGTVNRAVVDERSGSTPVASKSWTTSYEAGVRKKTILGTELELSFSMGRTRDNTTARFPDPRYEPVLAIEFTQPLLRFAGPDVNLAALHVAQLGHKLSLEQFRERVEQTVAEVRQTYWQLYQARRDAEIQSRLLAKTIETYQRVMKRRQVDATEVQIKQTEAAVEARKAALFRARKTVGDIQDRLARLLADKRLGLLGEYVIIPETPPVATKVDLDGADQLVTALANSPLLAQARLAIRSAEINVVVARNGTLPLLNLTGSAGAQDLRRDAGHATSGMLGMDYLSYSIGLQFEYPLGNREAESVLRARKFERTRAALNLQNAADQVAVAVNQTLREIAVTYEEMKANHAAAAASRIQLRALEDTERIRGRLTPEFLQVKLQAQEDVANAERSAIAAIVNHHNAWADLARLTGTVLQQHQIKLATESAIEGRPLPAKP